MAVANGLFDLNIKQSGTDRISNNPSPAHSRGSGDPVPADAPRSGAERPAASLAASASMARNRSSVIKCEQEHVARYPPRGRMRHGLEVDLLIAANGVCHRRAALGKGRRVEDNVIIRTALLLGQLCEQVKYIGAEILHMSVQPIECSIVPRSRERVLRHIDRHDGCRHRLPHS